MTKLVPKIVNETTLIALPVLADRIIKITKPAIANPKPIQ